MVVVCGEQVAGYTVEVRLPGGGWVAAGAGSAIGHKRIHVFGAPVPGAGAVRLNVTRTIGGVDPGGVAWASFAAVDGAAAGC